MDKSKILIFISLWVIKGGSHSRSIERKFCSVSNMLRPTRNVLSLVFEVVRTFQGFL